MNILEDFSPRSQLNILGMPRVESRGPKIKKESEQRN